jgi:release factor glutamine methyltransferase
MARFGRNQAQLLARPDELLPLENNELNLIAEQLAAHEPVQYVLGRAPFMGWEFAVGPGVLIPRPETEELVEKLLAQWPGPAAGPPTALEVGTGSGCIAVTLAAQVPGLRMLATDISPAALATARQNAAAHQVAVEFLAHDVLAHPLTAWPELDLLVSNPPYVTEQEKAEMTRQVLDYEPATALFVPNHDPLRFYAALARAARAKLRPGGQLWVEINERFGPATTELLASHGLRQPTLHRDLSGKDRLVQAWQP